MRHYRACIVGCALALAVLVLPGAITAAVGNPGGALAALLSVVGAGAVLEGGIFGRARNKLGSVVLSSWKGIATARTLVTPANPRTPAQQAQRSLFAAVTQALRPWLHTTAQPYVDRIAQKKSGFNRLQQLSLQSMRGAWDVAYLAISAGPLDPVDIYSHTLGTPTDPGITFGTSSEDDPDGIDIVHFVVLDRATGLPLSAVAAAPRNQGELETSLAFDFNPAVHLLAAYATRDLPGLPGVASESVTYTATAARIAAGTAQRRLRGRVETETLPILI